MANITSIKVRKTDTVYGIQDAAASLAIEQMKNGTDIDSFGDVETALADKADASDLNAILDGTDIDSFGDVETALAGKMQNYYLEENINAVLDLETGHTNLVTKTTDTISSGITTIPTSRGVDGAFTQIIVSEFTVLDNYAVGDYVKYEGKVYKCTTAHSAGAWVAGDFTQVKVLDEVKNLNTNAFPRDEQAVLGAKNLLPNTASSTGIFTVNSDGSVTVDGSPSSNVYLRLYVFEAGTLQSGNYILSGCPDGGSATTYELQLYDSTSSSTVASNFGGDTLVTIDSTRRYGVLIHGRSGATITNKLFKPMIRLATDTDDTYVPYAMTNRELTEKALSSPGVYYSTSEQVVGQWIDGKPVYQRTYQTTMPSVSGSQTSVTLVTLPSTCRVKKLNIFTEVNSGDYFPLPWNLYMGGSVSAGNANETYAYAQANVIQANIDSTAGSTFVGKPVYVTVQYTKTTD